MSKEKVSIDESKFQAGGQSAEAKALMFLQLGIADVETIRAKLKREGLAAADELGINPKHAAKIVDSVCTQFDKDVKSLRQDQTDNGDLLSDDEIEDLNEAVMGAH